MAPLAKAAWCLAALTFEFDLCNRSFLGPIMIASPSPKAVTWVDFFGAWAVATDERPMTAQAPNTRNIRWIPTSNSP